jgi:aromatic-L-amino-acid decarboxylase
MAPIDPRAQAEPEPSLFPAWDARQACEDSLTVTLGEALRRIPDQSVSPTLDIESFKIALRDFDFRSPRPLADLLPWVVTQLSHGVVQITHPRYFGLFNPCPTFPAECADRIVAAFNPQLATASTSPVAVELEAHVIRSIAQRAGLPPGSAGHFTAGGSEANFTALVCALTKANPRFADHGVASFARPPTVYVSRDAHLAWYKIAHQCGIGRAAVRLVETDDLGRIDPAALEAAIEADRAAGRCAAMVVATAGTTGAGMIDPLPPCAAIARAAGAWFHVDAAWGGALIASERLRPALSGIETADSVTIDGHKWFATTMGCGMFITSDAPLLAEAFQVATAYMPSNARHLDPYVTTAQWSRRFLGLRLFLALAAAGWDGYASYLERSIALADLLRQELTARGWTIVNASPLAVLCLLPPDGFPEVRAIVREVVASGVAWVSATTFQGRDVIRACITNGRTTPHDVHILARTLQSLGNSHRPARAQSDFGQA